MFAELIVAMTAAAATAAAGESLLLATGSYTRAHSYCSLNQPRYASFLCLPSFIMFQVVFLRWRARARTTFNTVHRFYNFSCAK